MYRVPYNADVNISGLIELRMLGSLLSETSVKVVAMADLVRLASAAEIYARLPLGWPKVSACSFFTGGGHRADVEFAGGALKR